MKRAKQLLSTFLSFCILIGILPMSAHAVGTTVEPSTVDVNNNSFVYINPEYEHLQIELPEVDCSTIYTGREKIVSTVKEAGDYLREQLVARNENIQ